NARRGKQLLVFGKNVGRAFPASGRSANDGFFPRIVSQVNTRRKERAETIVVVKPQSGHKTEIARIVISVFEERAGRIVNAVEIAADVRDVDEFLVSVVSEIQPRSKLVHR